MATHTGPLLTGGSGPGRPGGLRSAGAHQAAREALLTRIKLMDPDDSRLKRLHMFLSQENIAFAQRIIDQMEVKKQAKGKKARAAAGAGTGTGGKNEAEESSSSEMDDVLDDISEESHLDYEEFEQTVRGKIRDVKELLQEVIESCFENGKVTYAMQWNYENKTITKNLLAKILSKLSCKEKIE